MDGSTQNADINAIIDVVVVVVEDGRVSEVFASQKDRVSIEIIDRDTDDAERECEIQEAVNDLNARISQGELFSVY